MSIFWFLAQISVYDAPVANTRMVQAIEGPHLVFWQSLAFAFLILDTTRYPDRSDVGLDPAEIGGCGTGRVGHCAVKAVGSGKADVREGLEIKFQSDEEYF